MTAGSGCHRHPDREGTFFCQKDAHYMCAQCACCHSPRVYCQFRTACVIDHLAKAGDLRPCRETSSSKR
ncbi:MAG: hypothetical protein FJ118_06535 [Deltaproteobacteria bacterium]|nr:hypothetical protein [Deltaproteobacteria bacterium]